MHCSSVQKYSNNIIALCGPPFVGLTPVAGVGIEVPGFTVLVQILPALTTAALFNDNGITVAANPIVVPASGDFGFYAANGRYDVVISKPGIVSKTISDVLLYDPGEVWPPP